MPLFSLLSFYHFVGGCSMRVKSLALDYCIEQQKEYKQKYKGLDKNIKLLLKKKKHSRGSSRVFFVTLICICTLLTGCNNLEEFYVPSVYDLPIGDELNAPN